MPQDALLVANHINLTFVGGLRRAADYRLEDGAGIAIGTIEEHIDWFRRLPLGRLEPFRPHRFEIRDSAGKVQVTSFAQRALPRLQGDIYEASGALVAKIRQRRIGRQFPIEVRRVGTERFPDAEIVRWQRPGYVVGMLDPAGTPIVEAQPTGSVERGWRHRFLTYRIAFSESADVETRIIALGAFPIIHMVYVAPRG